MPYNRRPREVDVGPIGRVRLAQREMLDRRAAVHPPSATGGAPTQNPANPLAAAVGEDTAPKLVQNPHPIAPENEEQAFQERVAWRPPETPDVLSQVNQRANQEFERWVRADPDLVETTVKYFSQPMFRDALEQAGMDPQEFSERFFTTLRALMEPAPEARPMNEIIRPTLFSRRLLRQLSRWRGNTSTFVLPPIERGE